MAWLNATPKPDPRSKRAKIEADQPRLSRIEQMKKAGTVPILPPNPLPHIVDRLVEMGMTEAAGMGAVPLGWPTIVAWQHATGVELSPWEGRLIRKLSAEYLAEGRRAEAENCPPPWHAGVTAREIETERARLEMVLG